MTETELFAGVVALTRRGWIDIPQHLPGFGGTGAPGKTLEYELGLDGGNLDTPDAGRWELKFHGGNALLTLFHLEARPKGHLENLMIPRFGTVNERGQTTFRHTIHGTSSYGLRVVNDGSAIRVIHDNMPQENFPYWTHDTLLNAFVSKLRRVVVVGGRTRTRNGRRQVSFNTAWAYREPQISSIANAIQMGVIAIDFDVRVRDTGALRNHGTKFRIRRDDLRIIYHHRRNLIV